MLSEQLVKARLISTDAPPIEFMFNPNELTFEAVMETSESTGAKSKESGKPKVNFSHIKAYKVTISNILFDTYEEGSDVVATYIEPFKRALEFVGNGGEPKDQKPPLYTFIWGKRIYLRQCFFVEEDKSGTQAGVRIKTEKGHQVYLNDSQGKIEIVTKGGHKLILDDKGSKMSMSSTGTLSIEAKGAIDIKTQGVVNLSGSQINLG